MSETATQEKKETFDPKGPIYSWYWNDVVSPWNPEWAVRGLSDIIGLHRARDRDLEETQTTRALSDAHADIGDDVGAEFWRLVTETDRRPHLFKDFWWFDNSIIYPEECRFALPYAVAWLMDKGILRLPDPIVDDSGVEIFHPDIGYKTSWSGSPEKGAFLGGNDERALKIEEIAFDGRLTAETTFLAGFRLMTPEERKKAFEWDFDFLDPSRGDKEGK